jgi:ABC-2 type transport system ATP-binding protein
VRFAAAIAGDPQLLVLDEPTAAMDVQARRNFWQQIHAFAGRKIADGSPSAIKASFGDRQVRFTVDPGSPVSLAALAGVRAAEQRGTRVTLHSSDPDATVTSLVGSGLRWSDLEVGGLDLEASFLRLLGGRS